MADNETPSGASSIGLRSFELTKDSHEMRVMSRTGQEGIKQALGITPDQKDQRTREIIAIWLIGLLCTLVGLTFTAFFLTYESMVPDKRFENLKSLLDVLLGPIITLLSSVIGFYFGSRTAQTTAK